VAPLLDASGRDRRVSELEHKVIVVETQIHGFDESLRQLASQLIDLAGSASAVAAQVPRLTATLDRLEAEARTALGHRERTKVVLGLTMGLLGTMTGAAGMWIWQLLTHGR